MRQRALGAARNNPRQYVQRFGFTADNVLQVAFDSGSVDRLLSDAGLPIWGRERPATLVLLKCRRSRRLVVLDRFGRHSAEREAMARAAKQRGVPLIWPDMTDAGSDADQRRCGRDCGSGGSCCRTAARYNANAVLLGSARSGGGGDCRCAGHWLPTTAVPAPPGRSRRACISPPIRLRASIPLQGSRSTASPSKSRGSTISVPTPAHSIISKA